MSDDSNLEEVVNGMYKQLNFLSHSECGAYNNNFDRYSSCIIDMSPMSFVKQAIKRAENDVKTRISQPLQEAQQACRDVLQMSIDRFIMFGRFNFLQHPKQYVDNFLNGFTVLSNFGGTTAQKYARLLAALQVYFLNGRKTKCYHANIDKTQAINEALNDVLKSNSTEVEKTTKEIENQMLPYIQGQFEHEVYSNASEDAFEVYDESIEKVGGATLTRKGFFTWYINCLLNSNDLFMEKTNKLGDYVKCVSQPDNVCELLTSNQRNQSFYGLYKQFTYYSLGEKINNKTRNGLKEWAETKQLKPKAVWFKSSCYSLNLEGLHGNKLNEVILKKLALLLYNDVLLEAVFILNNNGDYLTQTKDDETSIVKYLCLKSNLTSILNTNTLGERGYNTKLQGKIQGKYYSRYRAETNTTMHLRHKLNVMLLKNLLEKELSNVSSATMFLARIRDVSQALYKDHIWSAKQCKEYDTIKQSLSSLLIIFSIFDDKDEINSVVKTASLAIISNDDNDDDNDDNLSDSVSKEAEIDFQKRFGSTGGRFMKGKGKSIKAKPRKKTK